MAVPAARCGRRSSAIYALRAQRRRHRRRGRRAGARRASPTSPRIASTSRGRAQAARRGALAARLRAAARAIAGFALPLDAVRRPARRVRAGRRQQRYADRAELLDYCRRSANPIGRLLLHLYGVADAASLRTSDAICTACSSPTSGRTCARPGARPCLRARSRRERSASTPAELLAARRRRRRARSSPICRLGARAVRAGRRSSTRPRSRRLGASPRRPGGLRILERIERLGGATLRERPTLSAPTRRRSPGARFMRARGGAGRAGGRDGRSERGPP